MPATNLSDKKLKNTYETRYWLNEITIGEDKTFVSFDIKSLFTSVPIEEVIEQVETILQQNHQTLGKSTTLDKDEIITLLKLCTEAAFFIL